MERGMTDDLFFDEHADLTITHRNRPHWKQQGKVHFVTWRQADSLAREDLDALELDREAWRVAHHGIPPDRLGPLERRAYYRLFHDRVERWLDAGSGSCVLKMPGPRKEVVDALHHFQDRRYRLGTFAVAGNHVHVLVVPERGIDLSSITHSWKSYTAKRINGLLGVRGTFWKDECFDHLVRSEASLLKFEAYIRSHDRQGAHVEHRTLMDP